jgi:hypothetical protein
MKRLTVLFFYCMVLVMGVSLAACTSGRGEDTAVAQTDEIILSGTPTAYPTPYPEMPVPDDCSVTRSPEPRFVPPEPYAEWPSAGSFWYGSNALWTGLRTGGIWESLPKSDAGYVNKIALWAEGYSQTMEPQPAITLSARQLDGLAEVAPHAHGNNAYHPDYGQFMMTGIELPTLGCWEITIEYKEASLSFVVWLRP